MTPYEIYLLVDRVRPSPIRFHTFISQMMKVYITETKTVINVSLTKI